MPKLISCKAMIQKILKISKINKNLLAKVFIYGKYYFYLSYRQKRESKYIVIIKKVLSKVNNHTYVLGLFLIFWFHNI